MKTKTSKIVKKYDLKSTGKKIGQVELMDVIDNNKKQNIGVCAILTLSEGITNILTKYPDLEEQMDQCGTGISSIISEAMNREAKNETN